MQYKTHNNPIQSTDDILDKESQIPKRNTQRKKK